MLASSLRRAWRYVVLTVLLSVLAPAAVAAADAVRLIVDYGDGVQIHFTELAWRDGMTALDALVAARDHRHGIAFAQRGSGASAMITKIGDQANEGGGERSRNWLFLVNEKPAEVGAGAYRLKSGDVVLWKFQVYQYNAP